MRFKRRFKRSRRGRRNFRRVRKNTTARFAMQRFKTTRLGRLAYKLNNIAAEKKWSASETSSATNVTFAGLTLYWNGIVEGLDSINRIGSKIFIRKWRFKLHFTMDAASVLPWFRMVILWPRTNSDTPNKTDILVSSSADPMIAQINLDAWYVLSDKVFNMGTGLNTGLQNTGLSGSLVVKKSIKINKTFTYLTATSTLPMDTTPFIWLLSPSTSSTDQPVFQFSSFLSWVDS